MKLKLALALVLAALPAVAQEIPAGPDATAAGYCSNLTDAAADARYANQLAKIGEAQGQVEARLAALEAKRKETEEWLTKRETFLKQAEENLVAIYAGMAPDAAAEQLAEMDELTAAAVVAKVQPKTAAAILNEMKTAKAARLATIISGLARPSDGAKS